MNQKLVVSFMHSNYMINSYGTEKFVRELSKLLRDKNYHHLCFFSFFHEYGKKAVGINFDDCFKGIYDYEQIINILEHYLFDKKMNLIAVHIHHFLNHSLQMIEKVVNDYSIPTYIFVHDFYIVCNHYKLIDSSNKFCGLAKPGLQKCADCYYKSEGRFHHEKMEIFLTNLSYNLRGLICPSEYVREGISSMFSFYKDKTVVRPHLVLDGQRIRLPIKNTIKIAYAGLQVADKGFNEWNILVDELSKTNNNDYEFYYFGTGEKKLKNVKNVYVSAAEQGEQAMVSAIEKYQIDAVLMWTMCPETYSYVYYEMLSNGVFVLTNKNSGNVCMEIEKNKNGMVFSNLSSCLNLLQDVNTFRIVINNYRADMSVFHPMKINKNESVKDILPSDEKREIVPKKNTFVRAKKNKLKTMAYCIKHLKVINV